MTVASVRFHSNALGRGASYQVLLPEVGEGPFPVLVQLHGLTDDGMAWIERSNLVRHVERLPLVVVLPDGGTSNYLNWQHAERVNRNNYEDLIMEDIPASVRRHFHVTDGPWAIGGLSMGGYGAMRLGLKYPDRFASIWSHSSAFEIDTYFPNAMLADIEDADLDVHARAIAKREQRPVIGFDCGTEDELIEESRAFSRLLHDLGIDHHYAEHPGAHTWDYWDTHVLAALAQHARVLGISAEG